MSSRPFPLSRKLLLIALAALASGAPRSARCEAPEGPGAAPFPAALHARAQGKEPIKVGFSMAVNKRDFTDAVQTLRYYLGAEEHPAPFDRYWFLCLAVGEFVARTRWNVQFRTRALVGAAAVFENHNLPANALEMYYRLRTQWPDAAWVKSKIFDLEQAAAAQQAAAAASGSPVSRALIMLGFGLPDDQIHGPNERQYLPNFFRGIETYVRFLTKLGQ